MRKLKIALVFSCAFVPALGFFLIALSMNSTDPITRTISLTGTEIAIVTVLSTLIAMPFAISWAKKHPPVEELTPSMIARAVVMLPTFTQFSITYLQSRLSIKSYTIASELADELERRGLVKKLPNCSWEILQKNNAVSSAAPASGMHIVDTMDGHAFEYWCADVLRKNGFMNVEVTRGSGDQGVDILAQKDGIKYAVQCKCYSSDLGNKPIQEVNAGKAVYHCQIGAVMTNRYFTTGAKQAAEATGTLLWDRNTVQRMAEIADTQ